VIVEDEVHGKIPSGGAPYENELISVVAIDTENRPLEDTIWTP
jgi:hypothetical protein